MPITRIAFNTSGSYTSAYYVVLNPVTLELNNNDMHSVTETLDGANIKQGTYMDPRPYVLSWEKIPQGAITNFSTMIATLKSYIDSIRYVNFGTADYCIPTLGWERVRVADVAVTVQSGGAIKYNVVVTLFPEPL
jgi:hypothetical protein